MNKSSLLVDTYPNMSTLTLVEAESAKVGARGPVLATLRGPVADYINPTKNNRLYTEQLLDRAFSSERVKELLATNNLLGEPDHPMPYQDRLDIHYPYVSHAITAIEKVPSEGCYYATIDILDTPNGRILKTLLDYGVQLGVSSRGTGSVINNGSGVPVVDPDTYNFMTFDIVNNPGNAIARLPVEESTELEVNESEVVNNSLSSLLEQVDYYINSGDNESLEAVMPILEFVSTQQPEVQEVVERVDSIISRDEDTSPVDCDDLIEAYSRIKELEDELRLSDNSAAEDTIAELREKCSALEEANLALLAESSRLRKINSKLSSELSQYLESQTKELEGEEEKEVVPVVSESEYNALNSKLHSYEQERKLLSESMDELERQLTKLSDVSKTSVNELSELAKDYQDLAEDYVAVRCRSLGLDPDDFLSVYSDQLVDLSSSDIEKLLLKMYNKQSTVLEKLSESASVSVAPTRGPLKVTGTVLSESADVEAHAKDVADSYESRLSDLIRSVRNT